MVQTFNIMNKAEMRSGLFILFFNIIQKYIIMKKIKSKFKNFNFIYKYIYNNYNYIYKYQYLGGEFMNNKFEGHKWYYDGSKKVRNDEVWWTTEYKEVPEYKMTRSYKAWLANKKAKEQKTELEVLKHKLEYQMKTYGEVDDIDFQEYITKVKEYQAAD